MELIEKNMLNFKYKVFLSAARLLSFSKAAKELSLTPPAVSFQVKHLEEELGGRLFLRYPNRIELTPLGKLLLKEAKQIDGHSQKTQEKIMRKIGKLWGTIVVGASSTVGSYFLPPILADFLNKYEDVELKVLVGNSNEVLGYLSDGVIDFAIVEGPVKGNKWEVEKLLTEELVVIAPTDFPCMGKGMITKKQLSAQPFITREKGSGIRAIIDGLKDGKKPLIPDSSIVLELGSNSAIKRVVEGGLGLSIVSLMALENEMKLELLSILRIKDYPLKRDVSFVFSKGKQENLLINEMVKQCRERAETQCLAKTVCSSI